MIDLYLSNGITLPDVGQELIAQALALTGALHQPGNVHKLNAGGHYLDRLGQITQRLRTAGAFLRAYSLDRA